MSSLSTQRSTRPVSQRGRCAPYWLPVVRAEGFRSEPGGPRDAPSGLVSSLSRGSDEHRNRGPRNASGCRDGFRLGRRSACRPNTRGGQRNRLPPRHRTRETSRGSQASISFGFKVHCTGEPTLPCTESGLRGRCGPAAACSGSGGSLRRRMQHAACRGMTGKPQWTGAYRFSVSSPETTNSCSR